MPEDASRPQARLPRPRGRLERQALAVDPTASFRRRYKSAAWSVFVIFGFYTLLATGGTLLLTFWKELEGLRLPVTRGDLIAVLVTSLGVMCSVGVGLLLRRRWAAVLGAVIGVLWIALNTLFAVVAILSDTMAPGQACAVLFALFFTIVCLWAALAPEPRLPEVGRGPAPAPLRRSLTSVQAGVIVFGLMCVVGGQALSIWVSLSEDTSVEVPESGWFPLKDSHAGFHVEMPARPDIRARVLDWPGLRDSRIYTVQYEEHYFEVLYYEMGPEVSVHGVLPADELEQLRESLEATLTGRREVQLGAVHGERWEVEWPDGWRGVLFFVVRDRKVYRLEGHGPGKGRAAARFVDSFALLDSPR
jgi:hypothetical protein